MTADGGARLHAAVKDALDDRLAIVLSGELDLTGGPLLATFLDDAVHDGVRRVEVDMAQVSFVDLRGLRVLLSAQQWCAERGVTLRLCEPQPHVLWLLEFSESAAVLLPDEH
ncbi:STAS domain-containing protein [Actinoplanes awajinensis]|uniref:STAS domain-containing protein n=1 Tax=Actinoplanes awajinensis subsp. mycoplanecinus TaxID=135947 RepID=A0A117MQ43_9ACTN|nr:STAS domain-containing protein [Actinoplanes awajinensis]KUL29606.1 hypothetical protein ADL15_27205 [Actinoplanes awajinensis subsp. mycoplanecinus]